MNTVDYKQFFDDNSRLIKLEGRSYNTTKKLIIYYLLGDALKHNHISLGLLEDDVRINVGIPIKSGYGKSTFKNFINSTAKALGKRCSVPTSLHPEQLVGKCIQGNMLVLLNDGNLKPIKDVQENDIIFSLDTNNGNKIVENKVVAKVDSGRQFVYEVITEGGRRIKATKEHPFLIKERNIPETVKYKHGWYVQLCSSTTEEWKTLEELKIGDEIAVPKRLTFGNKELPEYELRLIGYLLSEGGLTIPHACTITNKDERIIDEIKKLVDKYDCELRLGSKASNITYRICTKKEYKIGRAHNKVNALIKQYGLDGTGSPTKEIPNKYFELNEKCLSTFLNRLFAGDGSIYISTSFNIKHYVIEYNSSSKRLAEQVFHLLRRFGINSSINTIETTISGEKYKSYRVSIIGKPDIKKFLEKIGMFTKDENIDYSFLENYNVTRRRKFTDEQLIKLMNKHNRCIQRVADELGVDWTAIKLRWKKLMENRKEEDSDVMFIKIKEIIPIGEEQTYDIQMGNNCHNFVANDMIAHNSVPVKDGDGNVIDTKINKGHLADDILMFDEAVELLTDKSYQQARDYINIALDPIGDNEVFKRSVDTTYEDSVKYFPPCSMIFFWHPIPITETVVTRGLLRRLFVTNIVVDAKEREATLEKSVNNSSNSPELFEGWIRTLKRLSNSEFKWKFSETAKRELINLTKTLIHMGINYSDKISEFTDIMYYTLRNRLAKMACVLAALDGTAIISLKHIRYAYIDLREFWLNQMTYVEERVAGSLTYGATKGNIRKKMCLDILKEHKAFSDETGDLSIDDLDKEFAKRMNMSVGLARYYRLQLVRDGIVQTRKYAHDSRVWYSGAQKELEKKEWGNVNG